MQTVPSLPSTLLPDELLNGLIREDACAPLPGATWYTGVSSGDGLSYRFTPGALANARFLTADMLLDGNTRGVFLLELAEGEDGPVFGVSFALLNQCQARMRLPLSATEQNRRAYPREGAWVNVICQQQRVDLAKVDRMRLTVYRKGEDPVRWCMTDIVATAEEPALLTNPLLPQGPLVDEIGQNTLREWPTKSTGVEQVTARLQQQLQEAPQAQWPDSFSRWGGYRAMQWEASGFFRTHHDGARWWLVDPDGHPFWSTGLDCVGMNCSGAYEGLESALSWLPDREGSFHDAYGISDGKQTFDYLRANFIRTFGHERFYACWSQIALAYLRNTGFNTVANWSDWKIARAAGFPYVRPLHPSLPNTSLIFRDFPDVFHPAFSADAAAFAETLRETADDPAFIGYFLMNEPQWGFIEITPAEGMLLNCPSCETRKALADSLREQYGSDDALAQAWGMPVTLAAIADGAWTAGTFTAAARVDLEEFSTLMVRRFFGTLSDACRRVDPNHLNLGARYYTVPPDWAVRGMDSFDVFSVNGYSLRVRRDLAPLSETVGKPIMIGEWHFGALDVGLPGSGIGHVRDQQDRGKAYRIYVEDAAALPWCIGVHYFTLYDEAVIGRYDGENWNIGFIDVCHLPYAPLTEAARASHERLYDVAQGNVAPYDDEPEYLPLLF